VKSHDNAALNRRRICATRSPRDVLKAMTIAAPLGLYD